MKQLYVIAVFDVDIGDGLPTQKLPYNVGGQFDTYDD